MFNQDKVILIEEESHGIIGIARNYDKAIDCILNWNGELPIIDKKMRKGRPATEEEIKEIRKLDDVDEINNIIGEYFYLSIDKLW